VAGTHNLVNHDEDTRLGVLHGLEVAEDGAAQARVHARVDVAVEARRLDVRLLGHQQEDVGLCGLGDEVELVEDGALDLLRGRVDDELRVDVDVRGALCQASAMNHPYTLLLYVMSYQRDGRRVEHLAAHRIHRLRLARQAHVRHQGAQRAPLQTGQRLALGGRDGRLDAPLGLLADLPAQVAQVVDVLRVDGQLVRGRRLCRAFRMGPARRRPRARPHDVVHVRPREARREGHVEGQVDLRIRRRAGGPLCGRRRDGHLVVAPRREGEAGGRGHLLPAVPGLAGEVGYLVHVAVWRAPWEMTGGEGEVMG